MDSRDIAAGVAILMLKVVIPALILCVAAGFIIGWWWFA